MNQPSHPDYLIKGERFFYPDDETASTSMSEGALNDAPLHGIVRQGHIWYLAESHPMADTANTFRFSQGLIAGQVIAHAIGETMNISMLDIAGELGGAEPLIGSDPRKPAVVEAAQVVVQAGWAIALEAAAMVRRLTNSIIGNGGFDDVAPRTLESGATLYDVVKLLQPRGGRFEMAAGLAFLYQGEDVDGNAYVEPYYLFFNTLPSLDPAIRERLSAGITQAMKQQDEMMTNWSNGMVNAVATDTLEQLREKWPSDVSIEPAPAEAAAPPHTPPPPGAAPAEEAATPPPPSTEDTTVVPEAANDGQVEG